MTVDEVVAEAVKTLREEYGFDVQESQIPVIRYIVSDLGYDVKMFDKEPQLLAYRVDNIKPKVEYFARELGFDIEVVKYDPEFLGHSLDKRIKPRTEFLRSKKIKPSSLNFIRMSDAKFCKRIADAPLSEYEAFRDSYFAANGIKS